jgi:hypothetical protein
LIEVTFQWQVLQARSVHQIGETSGAYGCLLGAVMAGAFAAAALSLILLALGVVHVDVTIRAYPEAGSIQILTRNDLSMPQESDERHAANNVAQQRGKEEPQDDGGPRFSSADD